MTLADAVALIRCPANDGGGGTWYDLGAGSGTFTRALATLLAPGSEVHAVDTDARALAGIASPRHDVAIVTAVADLRHVALPAGIAGVLIANAMHFVREQDALLRRIHSATRCLITVDYERRAPSPWGPHPVDFATFQALAMNAGFTRVTRLRTYPSAFGGEIYSALAEAPEP